LPFPTLPYTGLHVLDSTGRIKDDVLKMCRSIASADAVLATGHLGPKEALTLLAAARKVGVRRMVVTHASEQVPGFSIAEQRAAIELGAWIEHSFLPMTPCGGGSLSAQALHDQLRNIGIERMILSSDFGQVANGPVVAGFLRHLEAMVAVGFSVDEIRTMVVNNPHRLLFGEPT
jgi:predicted metal-dependent phosphotriesterase family hydrolase